MAIMRKTKEEIEMEDRNKSSITCAITNAAIEHLRVIGVKAIETEVPIAERWVADIAGIWSPTPTECLRAKLLPPRKMIDVQHTWEGGSFTRKEDDPEQKWHERYSKFPGCMTIVHEVKTSYSDFIRDTKFERPPVADIQILSYLKGCVPEHRLPKNWWLWEHTAGGRIKIKPEPNINYVDFEKKFWLTSSIAERQHNRTFRKWQSETQKKYRLQDTLRTSAHRIRAIAKVILEVAKGEKNPEEVLNYYFNYDDLEHNKDYILPSLKEIHGIAKGRTQ